MKPELKKLLVLNLPYLLFVYLFGCSGQVQPDAIPALLLPILQLDGK